MICRASKELLENQARSVFESRNWREPGKAASSGPLAGRMVIHNTALIRWICGEVHQEADPEKIGELLHLLRAIIQNDLQEARIRMEFIRRKYAIAFKRAISADSADQENHG